MFLKKTFDLHVLAVEQWAESVIADFSTAITVDQANKIRGMIWDLKSPIIPYGEKVGILADLIGILSKIEED